MFDTTKRRQRRAVSRFRSLDRKHVRLRLSCSVYAAFDSRHDDSCWTSNSNPDALVYRQFDFTFFGEFHRPVSARRIADRIHWCRLRRISPDVYDSRFMDWRSFVFLFFFFPFFFFTLLFRRSTDRYSAADCAAHESRTSLKFKDLPAITERLSKPPRTSVTANDIVIPFLQVAIKRFIEPRRRLSLALTGSLR